MNFKTAVIGLGRIGSSFDHGADLASKDVLPRSHVGAILRNTNFELSAVCDESEAARNAFAKNWPAARSAKIFSDTESILDSEKFDLVVVATPTTLHFSTLKMVLNSSPRAVFAEKPFCATATEAKEIIQIANTRNVKIAVNFHRRWDRRLEEVKKRLTQLGKPKRIEIAYMKGLRNYGAHYVDLVQYFYGPVIAVSAAPYVESFDDPNYSADLSLKSGVTVGLRGIDGLEYECLDMDIYLKDRKIRLEFGGHQILEAQAKDDLYFPRYTSLGQLESFLPEQAIHGLTRAYEEIARHLSGENITFQSSAESAMATQIVLDAIVESSKTGKQVRL